MKWTKRKPTKPGWYWVHKAIDELPYIVPLYPCHRQVEDYAGRSPSHQFYRGAKWAGLIPEPEDTK
jgi:hypothetical protein